MQQIWAYGQALVRWGLGLLLVLGLVTGGLGAYGGSVWAATAPETPELTTSDISAEKISQFAQAYRQVIALIDSREAELRSAETQAEALQIEQDIETAALATIEATGLTGPEYLQLLGLANTDPELSQRIVTQLQESD